MSDAQHRGAGILPYILLALASLFWSGNHVMGRAIAGHVPPFAISTIRWAVPALLVLPFALPHLRRDWPAIRAHWGILLFLILTGSAVFGVLQYVGLKYTTAINMGVLNSFAPVLIAIAGAVLFGDRLSVLQAIGVAISLAGVLLIVAKAQLASLIGLDLNIGDLIILFNMSLWGIYSASIRKRPKIHWLSFTFLLAAISAMTTAPFFAWEHLSGDQLKPTLLTIASLCYASIFPTLIAMVFWNQGIDAVGANRAGAMMHLVAIYGAVLSWLLLGESLHPYHAVGFVLILLGVWLTARKG